MPSVFLHRQSCSNNETLYERMSICCFCVVLLSIFLSVLSSWFFCLPLSLILCQFCFVKLTFSSLRLLYLPINSSFICLRNAVRKIHICSFFTFVFFFPLCSKISRWERVTWEGMQNLFITLIFCTNLNCERKILSGFLFAVQLVCSAVSV